MTEKEESLYTVPLAVRNKSESRVAPTRDGYGYVYFAPRPDGCGIRGAKDDWSPWWIESQIHIKEDTKKAPISLTNHADTPLNPFPFLSLPREIRDVIYNEIIQPLRNPSKNGQIEINLRPRLPCKVHPSHLGYHVDTHLYYPKDSGYEITDPHEYSRILQATHSAIWFLSQVNHQIRRELGATLWKNVYLNSGFGSSPITALEMLSNRFVITRGLRSLNFTGYCYPDPKQLNHTVIDLCNFLSENCILDLLTFTMFTSLPTVRKILASEGKLAWVEAFRKVMIGKLKVRVLLERDDGWLFDEFDERFGRSEEIDEANSEGWGLSDEELEGRGRELEPLMEGLLRPPRIEVLEPSVEKQCLAIRD